MARELTIDGFTINDQSDCYVIAEIGHNHQGDLEQCKKMFDVAKECGANAVKLQKRDNRTMFTKEMYDSPYLHRNSYAPTYGEHRDKLEFSKEQHLELIAHSKKIGDHLLLHRLRHPERGLPRRSRHAGLQDRLRRHHQHPAASPCRETR